MWTKFCQWFLLKQRYFLAILELIKKYKRVLYIDIDFHHGDGVENAFRESNRVMTLSFHRFGNNFFPGSGKLDDIGTDDGKYYSVNFPLCAGINDEDSGFIFNSVLDKVYEHFMPEVMAGDEIGDFNLTSNGHGTCIKKVLGYNIPVVLLGGGGYHVVNVAKCWTSHTALVLNQDIDLNIPSKDAFFSHYGTNTQLNVPSSLMFHDGE